ncbi:MAG TPA: helix-turn-helix domain-containing protein [Modestobacter sp.]|nr:helix-turn-helix domain-containing protein [Modestobacter sp.]
MGNVVAEVPAGYAADPDHLDPARADMPGGAESGPDDGADVAPAPAEEVTARIVEFAARAAPTPVDPADLVEPAALVESAPERADRPTAPATVDAAGGVPLDDALDDALAATPRRPSRRRPHSGPNKREVRRQLTREAIVDAAAALFAERGFDSVSVLEIAQRAGVVEKTVFNHFPVKEGLVFETDPPMRAALVAAVRRRPAGESAAAAAGSFVVAAVSQLGAPAAAEGVAEMARVVRASRTLQIREREILGTLTDALAEEIALETHARAGALEPWLAAHAVLGLYAAMMELARDRVLAGDSGPDLVTELRTQGRRGLALLQFGLAGYAKRR